jgi:hypothetical protein
MKRGRIKLINFINYFTIRVKLRVRAIIVRVRRCSQIGIIAAITCATSESVSEYMPSSSTPILSYVALFFLDVDLPLRFVALSVVGTLFLTEGWHLRFVGEHCNGPSKSFI